MPWKASHPSSTTVVPLPEDAGAKDQAKFTIGFWPPLIAGKLAALRAEVKKPDEKLHPIRDAEDYAEALGLSLTWFRTMVKYGLRDWSGVEIDGKDTKLVTEEQEIDGRMHTVACDDHVEVLAIGSMLVVVGMKCWLYNALSEEEKKSFGLQSNSASSTSRTTAKNARPNGKAKATRSGSRGKTAKRSRVARTK